MKNKKINVKRWYVMGIIPWISAMGMAQESMPRANSNEANVISLAGEWQFQMDANRQGKTAQWFNKTSLNDKITLPSTTDEQHKGSAESKQEGRFTRLWAYEGPAWYLKTITVPDSLQGRKLFLHMERSKVTDVWYDGDYKGSDSSLITTQKYLLTENATAGTHHIMVRVTNGNDENPPVSGCHQLSNGTQTNWNGILGRIELRAEKEAWIKSIQAYTDIAQKQVKLIMHIEKDAGTTLAGTLNLKLNLWNTKQAKTLAPVTSDVKLGQQDSVIIYTYKLGNDMVLWDEFNPALYRVNATLNVQASSTKNGSTLTSQIIDTKETDFGMREFTSDKRGFVVNGTPAFMRGKHDAAVFPHTGYPPMDVEEWVRILNIYKSYGINHVRCHTWCPPLAAFEAADRVGIYWLPELPHWGAVGKKTEVIEGDVEQKTEVYDNTTTYLVQEGFRVLDEMGSQPSFAMFELGNEMSGSRDEMAKIIANFRKHDPRHLYAGGANNFLWAPALTPGDDYFTTTMTGGSYGAGVYKNTQGLEVRSSYPNHNEGHVNNILRGTNYDYSTAIKNFEVPIVSHETGQYQVYPNYNEISKYTGVTRAYNFETFKQRLADAGLADRADDFFRASGQLAALCYREDIESSLRTDGFGGFQLLDLQDFPGQGTALVGMLDSYLDSKGIITPEKWREFCSEVVPLLRHDSFTWTTAQTFSSRAVIANFGASDLALTPIWTVTTTDGRVVAQGELNASTMKRGERTDVGYIKFDLKNVEAPCRLDITLSLPDTDYKNSYPIWVYPETVNTQAPQDVKVFYSLSDEAKTALENGEKVLILPISSAMPTSIDGAFQSDFWCYAMFKKYGPPGTLGICLNPELPVFNHFPTEYHSNWQWWRLLKHGRPINLNTLPKSFRPTVEVIDNVTLNRRLGVMFEASVGKGKLLVCSMDLQNQQKHPEARQMLSNLLTYMSSSDFAPSQSLTQEQLGTVLTSGIPTGVKVAHSALLDEMSYSTSTPQNYKLSGSTITFDHSNALFAATTDGSAGYIKLDKAYSRLLIPVLKCTSKGGYLSSNTQFHYIDTLGTYRAHTLGDVSFSQTDSTQWVIPLESLAGGVKGIIGITNTNWSSVLTLTLGNVSLQQVVEAPLIGEVEKSRVPISELKEEFVGGAYSPSWASLSNYQSPQWFNNAKFGIWAHWGPQCQPEQGDWYARHMYEPTHRHYQYHVEHYGHPSEFGFKDVMHTWKAENWDATKLVKLYKRVGARYFMAMANHHDNLDLWDSRYHNWNSLKVGPEQNIIAQWHDAARTEGLPFGVSVHSSHAWVWYGTARGADTEGDKAGVPYDGNLTLADGKGKWWEGLDPQELYVQNHEPNPWMSWDWNAGDPSQAYCEDFYNRTMDLINKYHPDMVYFDDTALPLWPASDAGLYVTANYYNQHQLWTGRKNQCVVTGKKLTGNQKLGIVEDVEKGAIDTISTLPWQTCSCLGEYHYRRSYYDNNTYKSAETVIRMLCDIVSKNGNLLLSVPMRGDGTIDEKEEAILEGIASWMDVNSQCIYDTHPWTVFGEGPDSETPRNGKETGTYGANDFRFTMKGDSLYVIVMNRPADGKVRIKSLGSVNGKCDREFVSLEVLGGETPQYTRNYNALEITLPSSESPIQVIKIVLSQKKLNVKEPFVLRRQNSVEDVTPTSSAFGEHYKMTAQSLTFDHSNALISNNQNEKNGYLPLPEGATKLILHVNTVSSANAYNSDNTTLYYINANDAVATHNYGLINMPKEGNFDITFDLTALTDGCKGIIGITNTNWSSILTLNIDAAYFLQNQEVAYTAWGDPTNDYAHDMLTQALQQERLNVLDLTHIEGLSSTTDWHALAANPNILIYTADAQAQQPNEVSHGQCAELTLSNTAGSFFAPSSFTAQSLSFGPIFEANTPTAACLPFALTQTQLTQNGMKAYELTQVEDGRITFSLVSATKSYHPYLWVKEKSGMLENLTSLEVNRTLGETVICKPMTFAGCYSSTLLKSTDSHIVYSFQKGSTAWGEYTKIPTDDTLQVYPFQAIMSMPSSASLADCDAFIVDLEPHPITSIHQVTSDASDAPCYDVSGCRSTTQKAGNIYIKKGEKFIYNH